MNDLSIKENIRLLRKLRGLTQNEAARRCGLSPTHYRSVEAGSTKLINPILNKLADILDIGPGYLIFGQWNWTQGDFKLEDVSAGYGFSAGLNERGNMMRDNYEKELMRLRNENERLNQIVESQKRDISHLESVVKMMGRIKGIK